MSRLLTPIAEPMASTLRAMSAATVAVVNLEYDGEVLPVSVSEPKPVTLPFLHTPLV